MNRLIFCYTNYINKGFFFLFIIGLSLTFLSLSIPKKLEKKVHKSIVKTFKVENFQLDKINILTTTDPSIKIINSNNFYSIKSNAKTLGYALIDKAKSKSYDFDYLVLLNSELEIININILIYREEHGNEISSKRWLKQFFGLSTNDHAVLQKNIDGISGATISVRSMTNEMNNLLADLNILEKKNILPIN